MKIYKDRNWLVYWRVCRKMSFENMAKLAGCGEATVVANYKKHILPNIKINKKRKRTSRKEGYDALGLGKDRPFTNLELECYQMGLFRQGQTIEELAIDHNRDPEFIQSVLQEATII